MFAVSHGPIEGFSALRAQINTQQDWNTALAGMDSAYALGAEINGIDATQFETTYEARTGTGPQTPIIGSQGFVNYTDAGVSYDLGFEVPAGIEDIDNVSSGQVAYNSRMGIGTDPIQFVNQFLSTKCDRAVVQFSFPRGLYQDDNQNGDLENKSRKVRVQYWVTDAGGTATPTYVHVLPSRTFTNDESNAFSIDVPITMENPQSTVGSGGTKGYAYVENNTPSPQIGRAHV